jgi:mitochondrial protein import protein ZIM17
MWSVNAVICFVLTDRCQKRSEETFTKQAYHHGTVIIRCEGCRNLHLIADHLRIVSETRVELEDILIGKQTVRKGVFLEDRGSVVEFGEPEAEGEPKELLVDPETSKEEK